MSHRVCAFILILLASISLSGCGSSSPSDRVKNAIMKANEGNRAASSEILADSLKQSMSSEALIEFWDAVTKKDTVTSIECKDDDKNNVYANVRLKVNYKDGTTIESKEMLMMENGEWRMATMNLIAKEKGRSKLRRLDGVK